jgi:uncharacterized protein with HEPN domain
MPPIDDAARLSHILEAARKATSFTKGRRRSDLDTDEMLPLALLRLLEVMGEAAGDLSGSFCQAHPAIPWRQMAGMRNRLIHGYFDVDLDLVWQTVTAELPPLVIELKRIAKQEHIL